MQEYAGVRQIPGEPRRRWFGSKEFDLIVRVSDSQEFIDFELCYDKHHDEHSLTWSKTAGFSHMAVDDGEAIMGRYKQTSISRPLVKCKIKPSQSSCATTKHKAMPPCFLQT